MTLTNDITDSPVEDSDRILASDHVEEVPGYLPSHHRSHCVTGSNFGRDLWKEVFGIFDTFWRIAKNDPEQ